MDVKLALTGAAVVAVGVGVYWWLSRQQPQLVPVAGPPGVPGAPGQVYRPQPAPPATDDQLVFFPQVVSYCRDGTMIPMPDARLCEGRGGLYGSQPPAGVAIKPMPGWLDRQPVVEVPHPWWREIVYRLSWETGVVT